MPAVDVGSYGIRSVGAERNVTTKGCLAMKRGERVGPGGRGGGSKEGSACRSYRNQ